MVLIYFLKLFPPKTLLIYSGLQNSRSPRTWTGDGTLGESRASRLSSSDLAVKPDCVSKPAPATLLGGVLTLTKLRRLAANTTCQFIHL